MHQIKTAWVFEHASGKVKAYDRKFAGNVNVLMVYLVASSLQLHK